MTLREDLIHEKVLCRGLSKFLFNSSSLDLSKVQNEDLKTFLIRVFKALAFVLCLRNVKSNLLYGLGDFSRDFLAACDFSVPLVKD